MKKKSRPITKETKAAQNFNSSLGQLLNPMNVAQPGDPMTRLYANEDSPP